MEGKEVLRYGHGGHGDNDDNDDHDGHDGHDGHDSLTRFPEIRRDELNRA